MAKRLRKESELVMSRHIICEKSFYCIYINIGSFNEACVIQRELTINNISNMNKALREIPNRSVIEELMPFVAFVNVVRQSYAK